MTHQGRVHKISSIAEEKSKKILGSIPREEIVYRGIRRPLWYKIEFQDTAEEREYLKNVAKRYNSQVSRKDELIAHGTEDSSTLCQILLDGELRHNIGIENYGNLASEENIQAGGYWDRGWGVFVATPGILQNRRTEQHLVVPISELKGILLPNPIVELVKKEFPEHENLLKSYQQFAQEIETIL